MPRLKPEGSWFSFRNRGSYDLRYLSTEWASGIPDRVGVPDFLRDENFPANAVVSERKSVAEATVFVGFDD